MNSPFPIDAALGNVFCAISNKREKRLDRFLLGLVDSAFPGLRGLESELVNVFCGEPATRSRLTDARGE